MSSQCDQHSKALYLARLGRSKTTLMGKILIRAGLISVGELYVVCEPRMNA